MCCCYQAYAAALQNNPSASSQEALLAFVDQAVLSNDNGVDPVCGAAAEAQAYFNAYLGGKGEAAASDAAAIAYIDAVGSNPSFDSESPCGLAAKSYIANF